MRVNARTFQRLRRRLAREEGFTMIMAMGVLLVTSLLLTATFVALSSDAHLSQRDLEGKQAYYSARAGLNAFLYQLNQNSTYWQTCSNDTSGGWTNVPGASNGEQYQYNAVPANGSSACNSSNVVGSMIDTNSGELTMKFYGRNSNSTLMQRGVVASFKRASPLQYLWYTVYEAFDSSIGSTYASCNKWYRQGRPSSCEINWVTGDVVKGPMYTQDQLMVPSGAAPVFGRSSADTIASLATTSVCDASSCASAVFKGTPVTGVNVPEPSSNSGLLTDAQSYGLVYTGTTSIVLNSDGTATVTNCPSSCTTTTITQANVPIIYVQNGSGCSPTTYTPYANLYSKSGCTGDVYVSGVYTSPLTIAAANNIVVNGDITTSLNGGAVLGLIANQFVRVEHQVSSPGTSCGGYNVVAHNNLTIDAAILALQHSFIVDNFNCGAMLGNLTVNGAIVQRFRGPVGTGGNSPVTGYLKNYAYDDRLKYLSPPYLFDILNADWQITRETTCVPGGTQSSSGC